MSILESDWKKFKELRKIALDRFCQGFLPMQKPLPCTVRCLLTLDMECSTA